MPEFHLDTGGAVDAAPGSGLTGAIHFHDDLDAFTQGYVEALFFTGIEGPEGDYRDGDFVKANATGFSDLAPETLAAIIEDCRKFQGLRDNGQQSDLADFLDHITETGEVPGPGDEGGEAAQAAAFEPYLQKAGRDFWYTRNGHGCGFWDGDWPEPYASQLTDASKAFRSLDAYLGDDGKVYLS